MERLRCCHCGKFMKFDNAGLERSAKKVGFKDVFSQWEISETFYFHLECDKKVKDYKKMLEIFNP